MAIFTSLFVFFLFCFFVLFFFFFGGGGAQMQSPTMLFLCAHMHIFVYINDVDFMPSHRLEYAFIRLKDEMGKGQMDSS